MLDKVDPQVTGEDSDSAPAETPFPSDDEILRAGWIRPSRRQRIVTSTPRVGQAYWVDFPRDAYAPEFVGEHPGIIVRAARKLHDTCVVIPMTTRDQLNVKHTHKLKINPDPRSRARGVISYAVCDHLYTINIARLRPFTDRGRNVYPKVDGDDLREIYKHLREALPHVLSLELKAQAEPIGEVKHPAQAPKRPDGPNTLHLKPRPTPPVAEK